MSAKKVASVKNTNWMPPAHRSKSRPLPKEKPVTRTAANFPPPQPLPMGKDRYFGQTVKLLKPVIVREWVNGKSNEFPQALDGEFGTYQGEVLWPVAGYKIERLAVIKLRFGVARLPDDGTWFEVID